MHRLNLVVWHGLRLLSIYGSFRKVAIALQTVAAVALCTPLWQAALADNAASSRRAR